MATSIATFQAILMFILYAKIYTKLISSLELKVLLIYCVQIRLVIILS